MPDLHIYELDPTGGYCGFPAEIPGLPPAEAMRQELIRRNRVIKKIESELKIRVKRVFMRSPGAVVENLTVKNFINAQGNNSFPIFLHGDVIIHSGSFPDLETLIQKLNKKIEENE